MEPTFNKKAEFKQLESSTRDMVETAYGHCIYKCNIDSKGTLAGCKTNCYNKLVVPYQLLRHQGHSDEENLYKDCLASKLPMIKPEDYIKCSHNIYGARAEILMKTFVKSAEDLLADLH